METKRIGGTLDEASVIRLKHDIYRGLRQEDIAEKYNITQSMVSRIVHGYTWREVPWPDGAIGKAPMVSVKGTRYKHKEGIEDEPESEIEPHRDNVVDDSGIISSGGSMVELPDRPLDIDYKDIEELVKRKFEEVEDIANTDFHNAMFDVGKSPKSKKKVVIRKIEDCKALPWKVVLAALPTHPFIMEAADFPRWKLPIQVALAALPKVMWDKVDIREAAEQVATLYEYEVFEIDKEENEDDDE